MTIATAILAFVTFILAVGAFINIWQTRRIQAKERKDRQLREVADWAVDVSKAPLLVETLREPVEVMASEQPAQQRFVLNTFVSDLGEEARHVALILVAGEYIRNLAGHLDGNLASAVEDALGTLNEHWKLVADSMDKLSKVSGLSRRELESVMASKAQTRQRVQDSAKAIISRATELLTT